MAVTGWTMLPPVAGQGCSLTGVPSRPVAIVLALIAAGAVLFFWPRRPKNPEDAIRALVAECVADANKKDVSSIMDHVAEEFVGPQATRKQEVRTTLAYQLLRANDVAVILNPTLTVSLKSETQASLTGFFVFGRSQVKTAEELTQNAVAAVYKIDADLERRDGRWIFIGAQYQRVNGW
jgi:hypothetical protein